MRPSIAGISVVFLAMAAAAAFAGDIASNTEDPVLEEVIVTATLREVNLQDLPQSVGVLTESQLDDINALSLEDYWRLVPNLAVRDAPFGGNSVGIRGLVDTDSFQSTESINAFYVDDTAVTYVTGLFATPGSVSLLDISRVEVLRGPQGTLLGANAMGGAIRLISNEPDTEAPARRADLNLSSTDYGGWNHGGRFILNQPTGERSAIRLAALYQDDDGFIDDIGLGRTDVNDRQRVAGRFSWLWNATKDLEVLARVYAENVDTGGYNYADPIGQPWKGIATTEKYQYINYSPEPREEELRLASIRFRWSAVWGEFWSATSWYEKDVFINQDLSGELWFFFGLDGAAPFTRDVHQRDVSQEFRLTSNGSGRFNWLAGFYYLDQEAGSQDLGSAPEFNLEIRDAGIRSTREDTSLFGELSWRFTDTLEGVVGARWYSIDQELHTNSRRGRFAIGETTSSGNSDDVVPKVSLSWHVAEDVMLYGLVSQGFRPGQINSQTAIAFCGAREILDPDTITNYEVGIKSKFNEGRVRVNATAFSIDWDDMQFDAYELACPAVVLDNVNEASSEGFEVEFSWLVTDAFSVQGGAGYTDARISDGSDNPELDIPDGTRMPNVPEWTANVAGTWDFRWTDTMRGYLRADVQYVDARTTLFDQSPGFPIIEELPSYTLVNARLGAETGAWRAELFVNNLTNELAGLFCCRGFWDPAVNRPRTIGVRGTWNF